MQNSNKGFCLALKKAVQNLLTRSGSSLTGVHPQLLNPFSNSGMVPALFHRHTTLRKDFPWLLVL
jgi:hypothetical protein